MMIEKDPRSMQNVILAMLNGPEIVLIFAVVLILFGAKRLPELARGLGQGLREFKKASNDISEDLRQALNAPRESDVKQLRPGKPAPVPDGCVNELKPGNSEPGPADSR